MAIATTLREEVTELLQELIRVDTTNPPGNETAAAELSALPIEQREVIVAHLWGGLTFEQIAEVSGTSSSTAHRLYGSGLSTLRERLGVSCRKSRRMPN